MTNKYSKCNKIQAKCKILPQIQTIKHYEEVLVQTENSSNTTKRIMLRTAWLLLANYKDDHQIDKRENNDKQKFFQLKHNTEQIYDKKEKQQQIHVFQIKHDTGQKILQNKNNKQHTHKIT